MPVVNSLKPQSSEKSVSLSHGLIKHDDIYNEILDELIYTKASLLHKVYSATGEFDKELKATKEALLGEIKNLVSIKGRTTSFDVDDMISRIMNFLTGYGIIQDLVENDDISDIDFTRYNHCTVKENGVKRVTDINFNSDREFKNFSTLLIIRNGGQINADENHRRESDETYRLRINVAIPPRNVTGTSLIIRKHRLNPYNLDDLSKIGMFSKEVASYFKTSFSESNRNTLFVGKGASGKTTLLRACLMEVNPLNNYLIVEKDTELYMNDYPNFIIQRIKKESDGGKRVALQDLVKDGLTMSVEGMVVGELIGDETFDFLSAGYTDHVIYGTAHTSGVEDTATRLITMIDTGKRGLSESIINQIIAGSIHEIVYMDGFKVKEIKRITNYDRMTKEFTYFDVLAEINGGSAHE